MVVKASSLYSSPAMASSSLIMLPSEPSLPEGEIAQEQARDDGSRQYHHPRPSPITPISASGPRNDTSASYARGSPMARSSSQRRISLELSLATNNGSGSNLALQASPRGTRTPQPIDDYRFPSASTPTRQVPATRRQSSRGSHATNTGSSNTLSSTNYSTSNVTSITTASSRDYFSSDVGSSECLEVPFPSSVSLQHVNSNLDSPSVRRATRHVSLSGVAAPASGPASSSVESLKLGLGTPSGIMIGPVPIPPRPAYQHMRYNSEMNSNRNQIIASSRSDMSIEQKPRLRFESENGSLYTNTPGSFTNDDGACVSGAMRMARELSQSAVAPSKHKLVVVEEGKPNVTFQMGNCIGRGQFGSVYRALNLNTGQMVAVKRIKLEGLAEDEVTQLMGEVDLLKSLAHPSVVKYEGLVRGPDVVSIILEFVENGSLSHTLKAFGNFPEKLVASYVVKILEGLYYLHEMKVVHCDLKAANILTTKNGNVKLSDFGVSLNLKAVKNIKNDAVGTPNWMAPEVIELKGVSTAADIWSLGCTIIELLTGKPPYGDMLAMSALWRIVEADCPPFPEKISPLLRNFLTLCFQKDPTKRPSAEQLFEHEWLRKTLTGYKELRLQDSVPFLRRISADARRMHARSLHKAIRERGVEEEDTSHMERSTSSPPSSLSTRPHLISMRAASAPDSWSLQPMPIGESSLSLSSEQTSPLTPLAIPMACSPPAMSLVDLSMRRSSDPNAVFNISSPDSKEQREAAVAVMATSPSNPSFLDLSSADGCSLEDHAGRMHAFVKITFSKAVSCKVCRDPVKKHAVLCEECGLICHASCTRKSMLPCDLRTQLLMYSAQAFPSRGSMDIARATSPGLMRGNGAVSPALSSEQETPPMSPRLFKFSFARNKRNSSAGQTATAAAQATQNRLVIDHLQLPPTPTSGMLPSSTEPKTPTAADPPSELGSPGRRRRISLLPYLSRHRSPSPAPLSAAAMPLSRSTSSARIEQNGARRDDSLGYGSSISSAASSGLCDLSMSKTDSSTSNNANLDTSAPSHLFKRNGVHRHSVAAASTPQLFSVTDKVQHDAVEKARRRQSATPQRVTSRVSEVTFANVPHNTEGKVKQSITSPAIVSPSKKIRRISTTKQDCVVM